MVTARCTSTLLHSAWSSGGIYPIYRLLDPLHKLRCWDESDFLEKLIASGCGTCERECPGYEYRMSQFRNSEIVFNNTFQSVVCGYKPWVCGKSLIETFHIIMIYCIGIHVECYFWCIHIVARLMFVSSPTYLIMLELGDEKR